MSDKKVQSYRRIESSNDDRKYIGFKTPITLHTQLKEIASSHRRSLASEVLTILEDHVNNPNRIT